MYASIVTIMLLTLFRGRHSDYPQNLQRDLFPDITPDFSLLVPYYLKVKELNTFLKSS